VNQSAKQPEEDFLKLLSPRLRTILQHLAAADRRAPLQELIWLIEAYAQGQLKNMGDESVSPRIAQSSLISEPVFDRVSVSRTPGKASQLDSTRPTPTRSHE